LALVCRTQQHRKAWVGRSPIPTYVSELDGAGIPV
jgi:hypothetical protein